MIAIQIIIGVIIGIILAVGLRKITGKNSKAEKRSGKKIAIICVIAGIILEIIFTYFGNA